MLSPEEIIRRMARPRPGRFDERTGGDSMLAVVTAGTGGIDRLELREVPRPVPGEGEVLVRVLAAGLNNTDVNTRLGWYAPSVTGGTAGAWEEREREQTPSGGEDGGWNGATPFPLVQGVDCCGEIAAIGAGADPALRGRRVLVRPNMRPSGFGSVENVWMGCDFDGSFAQFVTVPASEVYPITSSWTDVELGSLPCAYGTAENMVARAGVRAGARVLVTGASGGVGSAAVQLARRRGASVVAVASAAKADALRALGAEAVVDRDADLRTELGPRSVDVVIDTVVGPALGEVIETLRPGGRYAVCGAIAGPMGSLDMRTVYLRDLVLIGCTAWDEPVFGNLVGYVERDEIRPVVAEVYPLEQIAAAQAAFLEKRHVGKIVLVPPDPG